ncbi:MAG: hypothetical protein RIB98_09235 [Acidimicrobiales bacterium]
MRRFRRSLLLIAGLLIAALASEGAARVVASSTPEAVRWYDEFAQHKIEQMDDLGDVDVVFAGTSMAWQAFVPSVFDEEAATTSYNAGLNGGTPEVMQRWLLEEVIPRTRPDTVVWGLSSYDFAPGYGTQQRDVYDNALATRNGWLASVEQQASQWSVLVRERTVLRSLNDIAGARADEREANRDDAVMHTGNGGERLLFERNVTPEVQLVTEARLADYRIDPDDRALIVATIETLRTQGIEVVLVNLPVPDRFIDAHPRGLIDYRRVAPAVDEIATELDVRFLDLSGGFTDDDFVDFTHLIERATRTFSVVAATAFASDRDDRGTTETPLEAAGATGSEDTDCTTRTVIDEYGFEVEVIDCTGDPDTPSGGGPP